ncbi:tagaturonate reductase [Paenibacillus arenilitoris]|uniref:Tagaturonate reductase n=1 Tax=Paenibacillus arenilitoris TaxID=2772299 RepID=A0A927H679_9BACL|nr:tagaturonate reductase [Paenibacillus arenilitoris]MBD2869222.1 tagaturonate reductase [Paenibacillus arenilitoris]
MNKLNRNGLTEEQRSLYEQTKQAPVTVLQIGEGNFLRGFFDWMLHECRKRGLYEGSVAVTQPRPGGKPKIEALAEQDGLYTLVIRGLENGESVQRTEVISVFREAFDPYSDWDRFLALAESADLRVVVSNTTEAGLAYRPEELADGQPVQSFPGKLTQLLYRRYVHFKGDPARGLICLPCELLERNGDELRSCVLRYSDDWGYPEAFKEWVARHNRFLNSLVDRIVTGYPGGEQAEAWFGEWGYADPMLSTAEPYHLWAIEAEPALEEILPLRKAGLNVHWVSDLKPFQLRKVRILNGAHTLMTPIGLLHGIEQVREAMEHGELGPFVRGTVEREIVPSLPIAEEELKQYAAAVYERFLNPFIRHRLSDIAMNSLSKFKVRLLPSLMHYAGGGEDAPQGLVRGFAGLLRYYKVKRTEAGFVGETLGGASYAVRDDAGLLETIAGVWAQAEERQWPLEATIGKLLGLASVWGRDLAAEWPELPSILSKNMTEMERSANE